VNNLPQKRDPFYAACVKAEIQLLRGMLVKLLEDFKESEAKVGKDARSEILELIREIRENLTCLTCVEEQHEQSTPEA